MPTTLRVLMVLTLGGLAQAQLALQPAQPQEPVTFSIDPLSQEVVTGVANPTDIYRAGSSQTGPTGGPALTPGGGQAVYTAADLGLTNAILGGHSIDIDAISTGLDVVPHDTLTGNIVNSGREFSFVFSVARAAYVSDALRHGIIDREMLTNGAASDTYCAHFDPAGLFSFLNLGSDALGVTPMASSEPPVTETDVDALTDAAWPIYPVFFSVSPETASLMGVSGADIFVCFGPQEEAQLFISHEELGVPASYDVDALIVRRDNRGSSVTDYSSGSVMREVYFSLREGHHQMAANYAVDTSPGSFHATATLVEPVPANFSLTYDQSGAYIYRWWWDDPANTGHPQSQEFLDPAGLGLSAFDDVNASWGHDPRVKAHGSANGLGENDSQPQNDTGLSADSSVSKANLLVNNATGGQDRVLEIDSSYGAYLTLSIPDEIQSTTPSYALFLTDVHIADTLPTQVDVGQVTIGYAMVHPSQPSVVLLAADANTTVFGAPVLPAAPLEFEYMWDPTSFPVTGETYMTLQALCWDTSGGLELTNAITLGFNVSP